MPPVYDEPFPVEQPGTTRQAAKSIASRQPGV
jgi:hypothetical protein